jgi:hypothetical protein
MMEEKHMIAEISQLNNGKYKVIIPINGRQLIVGLYETEENAVIAKQSADLVAKFCLLGRL